MSPIANMLIAIKNAQAVGHKQVMIPFSRMKFDIANVLKEKGFIDEIEKKQKQTKKSKIPYLNIILKYDGNEGKIHGIKMISKPSRRIYIGKNKLHNVKNGFGIAVVTTSKGVMSGNDAKKANVGGELLFEIW